MFKIVNSDLNLMFEVEIQVEAPDGQTAEAHRVMFKMKEKQPHGSEISFDGGATWYPTELAVGAVKAFEDRFPLAFSE